MKDITVLGSGSWGTALSVVLSDNGYNVLLWTRNKKVKEEICETRENKRYLPEIFIPYNVNITEDIEKAAKHSDVVVLAVPSQVIGETVKKIVKHLSSDAVIVNTSKGLDTENLLRLSQVIEREIQHNKKHKIAVLSGPSHAEEVGRKFPSAVVSASNDEKIAKYIQDIFISPYFRVYTNLDLVGVELGGALKNVMALSVGISDGLGFGDNSKAALMTRGLAEIARLGEVMGAKTITFSGLAGVGDLFVTCTSKHSRNRRAGIALGEGKKLDVILKEMGMVVEGITTTNAAYKLSREFKIEMPITTQVYNILFNELEPIEGVENLMERGRKDEIEEVIPNFFK